MRLNKLDKQISFLCIHYAESKQPLQSIDSVPHIEWHGEQLVRTVDLKHGDREYLFDARPRQLLCTVCRDLEQVLIKHDNYCSAVLLQRMQYYCSWGGEGSCIALYSFPGHIKRLTAGFHSRN